MPSEQHSEDHIDAGPDDTGERPDIFPMQSEGPRTEPMSLSSPLPSGLWPDKTALRGCRRCR
jgi:hypothetical protein